MRVLGLDPGETTGFALIDVSGKHLEAVTYGIIPRLYPGDAGLVKSVREWLEFFTVVQKLRTSGNEFAFEEAIARYRMPTRREAVEVRAVIREWLIINKPVDFKSYTPQEIRSQFGLPQKGPVKAATADFVSKCLGYKPNGPDHVTDAFAVALCHALHLNIWLPQIDMRKYSAMASRAVGHRSKPIDVGRMTSAELRDAINSGKVRLR